MLTRRQMMVRSGFALLPLATRASGQALPSATLPLPDAKTFQAGDFIWPKKPGAFVPYHATERDDPNEAERRWNDERARFLANVFQLAPHFSEEDVGRLRRMSFREFYSRYAGDQMPDTPGVYSTGGGVYVGHVGIIDIDGSGSPWVVEALLERGVVRNPYQNWLRNRSQEVVWHGRLRDIPAERRVKIAVEAKRYVGRSYDFWNFDLNDDKGFYCSKLVWLAIFRSLGFAVDGNSQSKRTFWFSPKQLLYLKTIARLHDPGPYAFQ